MSSNDVIGGAAVPLTDALPWTTLLSSSSNNTNGTYLINDSIGASGQFLLYTLASQVLAQQQQVGGGGGKVLWLCCGPSTPSQILLGLKKLGGGRKLQQQQSRITVRNLISEFVKKAEENGGANNDSTPCKELSFLKQVYQSIIDTWQQQQQDESTSNSHHQKCCKHWILIDDVSALANLLGERIVYGWILALNATKQNSSNTFNLVIRCSNDQEEASLPTFAGSSVGRQQDWFGASSSSSFYNNATSTTTIIPWERSFIELADWVLDVLPLTSGYTREIQGRIIMTRMPHSFQNDFGEQQQRQQQSSYSSSSASYTQPPMQIINYGITDQQKIVAYIM